jgi:Fe-S cluster assembly protein SufD
VWRYSPIDRLDLDAYRPMDAASRGDHARAAGASSLANLPGGLVDRIRERSGLVVLRNGVIVHLEGGTSEHMSIGTLRDPESSDARLGEVLGEGDALTRLNDAFVSDGLTVEVTARAEITEPLLIVHWIDTDETLGDVAPAVFPRTIVRLGENAQASVVEVVIGATAGAKALVLPVVELDVGDGSRLAYVSMQRLGDEAWHIARTAARVGRDASVRMFSVGLGGAYDRSRVDIAVVGRGGSSEVRSAYLGTGKQVHDVRTLQDHMAERTTSDLLCKGAVGGSSRSIYTGLIRVRRGAVRSDAFQTNHNLVLGESAHADSVPNLDIEENDVRCSHASTVGPIDEDQRYYVESRGVPPERATMLIVQGFYDDIMERCPIPAAVTPLAAEVSGRLSDALGVQGGER